VRTLRRLRVEDASQTLRALAAGKVRFSMLDRDVTETPRTLQEDEAGKFSLEFSYYSS
jgi:hypothetical protein